MSEIIGNVSDEQFHAELQRRLTHPIGEFPEHSARAPQSGKSKGDISQLQQICEALNKSWSSLGTLPHPPPTWRGRLGRGLAQIVQRALSWYTPQIMGFHALVARGFQQVLRNSDDLATSVAKMQAELAAMSVALTAIQLELRELKKNRSGGPRPEPPGEHYSPYNDACRGTRDEIKQRVQEYIAVVVDSGAGAAGRPVLDLGCGRGEWLETLREHGLTGRGVDSNRIMIEGCRELGLDAVEADPGSFLSQQPDCSAGAVTSFHIVEHLPFRAGLISILDEVVRVLQPGGVAIFETPDLDPMRRNPAPTAFTSSFMEQRGLCRIQIRRLNGQHDYAAMGWKPSE